MSLRPGGPEGPCPPPPAVNPCPAVNPLDRVPCPAVNPLPTGARAHAGAGEAGGRGRAAHGARTTGGGSGPDGNGSDCARPRPPRAASPDDSAPGPTWSTRTPMLCRGYGTMHITGMRGPRGPDNGERVGPRQTGTARIVRAPQRARASPLRVSRTRPAVPGARCAGLLGARPRGTPGCHGA